MKLTCRYDNSCLWEGEATDIQDALERAVKSGADLSRAYLPGADLSRAVLSGAVLSGADLSGADLSGAYLPGADLSRAKIRRIIQIGPIGLRDAMLVVWVMEDSSYRYSTGCLTQIAEEQFRARVASAHCGNRHGRAYMEAIEFAHRLAGVTP